MNMARQALKTVALVWLALVVMTSGASGMVLCHGADGHVSLESAHQGHCRHTDDSSGHGGSVEIELAATAADCFADCVDVPLSSDNVRHLVFKRGHVRPGSHPLLVPSRIAVDSRFGGNLAPSALSLLRRPPSQASFSLLAQRTTVLRL